MLATTCGWVDDYISSHLFILCLDLSLPSYIAIGLSNISSGQSSAILHHVYGG